MSQEYQNEDPLVLAKQAERDLNSYPAKTGHDASLTARYGKGASDSTLESGIDLSATHKFPGSTAIYGSAASGAGDNREIPLEDGGDIKSGNGRLTKARDFEGLGGPEDKARRYDEENPGNDDVRDNIRQAGETVRPPGQISNGSGMLRK